MLRTVDKKHHKYIYNTDESLDNTRLLFNLSVVKYVFISSQLGRLAQFARRIMLKYDIIKARISLRPVSIDDEDYYKLELFDVADRFLFALTIEHTDSVICYKYIKRGVKDGET